MKMISRKRFRKRVALFLLLVLFVPFVPVISASADVSVPDFPYLSQSWYDTNTDSFALWEVHGSDKVSYVQTRTNVFSNGAFPVVYRSGLSWSGSSGYYYYIDYSKITDTWTKAGNHVDGGYSWSQNIRVPAPNETTVDSKVYATLVYCNTDIYHGNGAGDNGIYAYQNFIVPSYADPTPTPTPEPEIDKKFPTFINAYYDNRSGDYRYINFYLVVNRLYDEANTRYEYDYYFITERRFLNIRDEWEIEFLPKYDSYDFINNKFTARFLNVAPDGNWDGTFGSMYFTSSNYKTESDIYDLKGKVSSNAGNKLTETSDRNYELSVSYDSSLNYEATAVYIINTDGSTIRVDGDGGSSATPTPTVAPTVIPQPSITPTPTDPPEVGDDNNYTGLFGWLKRIRDAILNIPKKIVSGILSALKYIFIPDIDKVKSVFNTVKNKFGIQQPKEFTFDVSELYRPKNVIWKFHPISLNGEPTEAVDITLINFEMVDEWLDSAPGGVITRLLQAMFGITMFAYAIYIFTKHIASINYTDARTLMHLDDSNNSSSKGGWWIKDD